MQTIDIHSHLLNPNVKFDRLFDKIAIQLFMKRLGIENKKEFLLNPYEEYKKLFIKNIKNSKYVSKSVIFPVDSKIFNNKIIHTDQTVCSSNEDLYDFYKDNEDLLIPFFSINPLRENSLDLIDEYYEKGFKGAKFLQNYWGVNTNDVKFIPYYEKLKKYNLPLIIHTGSEYTINSVKEYESIKMLELPLEIGVNVIAAHMGLGILKTPFIWKNFSTNKKHFVSEYEEIINMLKTYPNLYADLSAIIIPLRSRVLIDLKEQKDIHGQLLFGTDYPVPFSPHYTYDISFKNKNLLNKIENPLDRYIETLGNYFDIENSDIWYNYNKILKF